MTLSKATGHTTRKVRTMEKKQSKKLDDKVFNAKSQLAVLRVVSERVHELRTDIRDGIDTEKAEVEIEELRAYCSGGFPLSYFTMQEMTGESVPVQEVIGSIYEVWLELWRNVCDGYQPFISGV